MTHINQRRDTAANWTATNPVLQEGEVGWEEDTRKCKLGNGTDAWVDLDYTFDPDLYALLDSPAFTGDPTAPTQASADDSTKLATTQFVHEITDDLQEQVDDKAPIDSPEFTGNPTVPIPGALDDDGSIAPTQWVNDRIDLAVTAAIEVPTGSIMPYAGTTEPTGWFFCDGAVYLDVDEPALSAVLGNTFGGVPGTSFAVPDLQGRFIAGLDLTGDPAQDAFDTRGEQGGVQTHNHELDENAWARVYVNGTSGDVEMDNRATANWTSDRAAVTTLDNTVANSNPGGAVLDGVTVAASNLPPYMTLHYIIKT